MDRRSPMERAVDELMRPRVREDHFPKEGEDEIAAWIAPIESDVDAMEYMLDIYSDDGDLGVALGNLEDTIFKLRDNGEKVPAKVTMLVRKIRRCLEEANGYWEQLRDFISDA